LIFGALASFGLAVVVLVMIAKPLLVPPIAEEVEEASELRSHKEKILEEIRDLDMDYAAGKLSEEDYRQLRSESVVEAAEVMKQIELTEAELALQRKTVAAESQNVAAAAASLAAVSGEPEDEIEAEIRARREALRAKREEG
jgi:hypothetical protein